MISDPIADLLIRIKNAALVGKREISVPYSRFKENLAKVLQTEGYLEKVAVVGEKAKKDLNLTLAPQDSQSRLAVRIVSKPGKRVYLKAKKINVFRRGKGITIISTPAGLMTDKEALKKKLGGEIICKIS